MTKIKNLINKLFQEVCMPKITLRYPLISDAARFFEILCNPNFIYFNVPISSVAEEEEYIKGCEEKRKRNFEYNYSIVYNNNLVGGCGIKIDQHRNFIGEIGYFVAEEFWGKGIATEAVKLMEKIAFKELKLKRVEILMKTENKASEKVAIKNGYVKEGIKRKAVKNRNQYFDVYLYAKIV